MRASDLLEELGRQLAEVDPAALEAGAAAEGLKLVEAGDTLTRLMEYLDARLGWVDN